METKEKPAVRGAYQDVWPMSGKVASGPFPTSHPIEIPLASTNLGKHNYVHGNARVQGAADISDEFRSDAKQ